MASRLLCHALGGGLGPVTRTRAVLEASGFDGAVALLAAPGAAPVAGGLELRSPGYDDAADPPALARWIARQIADWEADALLVDALPGGVMGELCGLAALDGLELRHTARLLRWAAYARRLEGPLPHYDAAHVVEPLHPGHERALAGLAGAVAPLDAARAAARRPAARAGRSVARRPHRPGARGARARPDRRRAPRRRAAARGRADHGRGPAGRAPSGSTRSPPRRATPARPGSSPPPASTPSASSPRTATGTSASRSTAGSTTSTQGGCAAGHPAPRSEIASGIRPDYRNRGSSSVLSIAKNSAWRSPIWAR